MAYSRREMGGPDSPLFQCMIFEIRPKVLENFSRKALPRVCESLRAWP